MRVPYLSLALTLLLAACAPAATPGPTGAPARVAETAAAVARAAPTSAPAQPAAVGLVIFISAVREIPTVVLLASSETRTLSLLMLDYLTASQLEKAVVLGVFVTAVIVVAALVARFGLGLRSGAGERH